MGGIRLPGDPMERFLAHVAAPNAAGCELWTGRVGKRDGYARFTLKVDDRWRSVLAHRWIWNQRHGAFPLVAGWHGACVRHTCDVRSCMADAHHVIGSQTQNIEDRQLRSRQARGAAIPIGKLTEEDVAEIRRLGNTAAWTQRALGRRFGVAHQSIGCVLRGSTWKHV